MNMESFEPLSPKAVDLDATLGARAAVLSLAQESSRIPFRKNWGLDLWKTMKPRNVDQIDRAAALLVTNKARYKPVEAATGVPYPFIAAVHWRESAADFRGVLHNGQRIIGTGQRTTLVPKGRGPFFSWEEAAVDALRHMDLDKINDPDDDDIEWTLAQILYQLERYNGFGYVGRVNSPYVWSFTQHHTKGKYVRDGVYDANAVDKQIGVAILLQRMALMDDEVKGYIEGEVVRPPEPEEGVIDAFRILKQNMEDLTGHRVGILLTEQIR